MKNIVYILFFLNTVNLKAQQFPVDTFFLDENRIQVKYKEDYLNGMPVWVDYVKYQNDWFRLCDTAALFKTNNFNNSKRYISRAYFNNFAYELFMVQKYEGRKNDMTPYLSGLDLFFDYDRRYWLRFGFHHTDSSLSLISIGEPDSTFNTRIKGSKVYFEMPIKKESIIEDGTNVQVNELVFSFLWEESEIEKRVLVYNPQDKTSLSVYISRKTFNVVRVEKKYHELKRIHFFEYEKPPLPHQYGEFKLEFPSISSYLKIKDGRWRKYNNYADFKEEIWFEGELKKIPKK